jgi:hypothetical protein
VLGFVVGRARADRAIAGPAQGDPGDIVIVDIEIPLPNVARFGRKAKVPDKETAKMVEIQGLERSWLREIQRDDFLVARLAFNCVVSIRGDPQSGNGRGEDLHARPVESIVA